MRKILVPLLRYSRHMTTFILGILCSYNILAQCGGPSFPADAETVSRVPEAAGFNMLYKLPIPSANQAWATPADVPYSINNAGALASSPFTRIAYYVKLESPSLGVQWAWVSMDAFTTDVTKAGIPVGNQLFQQLVTNMNVRNNSGTNKSGITGNIEFWSGCYNAANGAGVPGASATLLDFGDTPETGTNCYGSFQVHDYAAAETVLAYNGWAFAGFNSEDLGIGNFIYGTNPDWTFADNAHLYSVKELFVFINSNAYQPTCTNTTLYLGANGMASLTTTAVTNAVVGNCGVTSISLSKNNFDCSNRGTNNVTVSVMANGITHTCSATVTVADTSRPVISATGANPMLGCNPTAAQIEASLGTATAKDNCGAPVVNVNTAAVVSNGNNRSQTRTWVATDASGNSASLSRTITWSVCNTNAPHIFSHKVSCKDFNEEATPLEQICYQAEKRKVKKVSPGSFYYYTHVIAPNNLGKKNSFIVDVRQVNNYKAYRLYEVSKVEAFDGRCKKDAKGDEISDGQARITITDATPGTKYTIAVKYKTKSIEKNDYQGNTPPVVENKFTAYISTGSSSGFQQVPGSAGSILTKPGCYKEDKDDDDDDDDDHHGDEHDRLQVMVYSNPTHNYFSLLLNSGDGGAVNIKVVDMWGKTVYSSKTNNMQKAPLRIGDTWKAGMYFAEITQNGKRSLVKLVKL